MKRGDFLKLLGFGGLGLTMMNLQGMSKWMDTLPATGSRMPVLFVGHGSPMIALDENYLTMNFASIGKKLPRPRAILCHSAHWTTNGTFVSVTPKPKMIYDMSGFPDALYKVNYPAPGYPSGANDVIDLVRLVNVQPDKEWGFDHGNWTIMKHLYPKADIPVFQLSIDYNQPMGYHFELASQLRSLREKGILIIGSGNITHNLRNLDFSAIAAKPFDWDIEFDQKLKKWIDEGDYKNLIAYKESGASAKLAVPEPSHYFPLIYSLALRDNRDSIRYFNDIFQYGSLSMRSVIIGE